MISILLLAIWPPTKRNHKAGRNAGPYFNLKHTEMHYTKDLKKGMKVLYYNAVFIVTNDAVNLGQLFQGTHEVLNNDLDVYAASCKYVKGGPEQVRHILKAYKYFQSNSTAPMWDVIK